MHLHPYQDAGAEFLMAGRRRYLADEMGLGKTVQAFTAMARLGAQNSLWVAPASTIPNAEEEARVWGPKGNVVCVSYSKLIQDPHLFQGRDWDVVVLDEAHYAKSRTAQRTLAALTLARDARYAFLLSGTPAPNHPGELWAPIRALWPWVTRDLQIENYTEWLNTFCIWRWNHRYQRAQVFGAKNENLLKPYLRKIMLGRKWDDEDVALDLPPIRVDLHRLPADSGFEEAISRAGFDRGIVNALSREVDLDEAEQSTSRLRRLLGEYKAPRIGEQIAGELQDKAYRKIIVMAYHRNVLAKLRQQLEPFGLVYMDGSSTQDQRKKAVHDFKTDSGVRVFLAQQTSAGVGLNLQVANEIVLVEPEWSPDANAQAIKRIHRIGQDKPCRARLFTVAGSLDEAIMGTVRNKLRMQRSLGLK